LTYNLPEWAHAPLLRLIQRLPPNAVLISNNPYGIRYSLERPTREGPVLAGHFTSQTTISMSEIRRGVSGSGGVYYALFTPESAHIAPDGLAISGVRAVKVTEVPGGSLWRFEAFTAVGGNTATGNQ
jgi:hypothetical protein